jgi:hypothetical protein
VQDPVDAPVPGPGEPVAGPAAEEASRGAVPFQEANRSRLANRRGVGDVGGQPAYRQPSAGATWVRMVSMTWAL